MITLIHIQKAVTPSIQMLSNRELLGIILLFIFLLSYYFAGEERRIRKARRH